MKSLFLLAYSAILGLSAHSQATQDILKQQAGQGVKEGANVVTQKAGEKLTDKLLNHLFEKKAKQSIPKAKEDTISASSATKAASGNSAGASSAELTTYSKFDFIPGDKVLSYDDFSKDQIGDFPASWNTNGTGEVVNASGMEGHWLMIAKQGKYIPEYIKSLPDNFTFECDIVCNEKFSYYSPALSLYFLTGKNDKSTFDNSFIGIDKRSGVKLSFHPTDGLNNSGEGDAESFENGETVFKNKVNTTQFKTSAGMKTVHVSIWRQMHRLRVYLNEEKIFDIPRAFADAKTYTAALFEIWGDMKEQDRYLLGNVKFAAGLPDTRTKLMTEGKFVTSGILFDVNSDRIKPQSYGVLKDIAAVLAENSSVNVKIVGHTDSDGSTIDNINLSKRRAEAVKASLMKDFGIDGSRLQTGGKGATQPVDSNTTAEGKANNRRVEFIKL
ncbi:MAG: OmpA family protein [Bacteroidetes bacterium]|nr:MAG: OmpA family protein [Bacteroidota bacterium]